MHECWIVFTVQADFCEYKFLPSLFKMHLTLNQIFYINLRFKILRIYQAYTYIPTYVYEFSVDEWKGNVSVGRKKVSKNLQKIAFEKSIGN
jgi:hypothetical protein